MLRSRSGCGGSCYDLAPTATGKLAPVPLDIDILVAGFPCVDFSRLNKHRKQIKEGGKSGEVFFAIWEYIDKARPTVVILENVTRCEWQTVIDRLRQINYIADYTIINTLNAYLPQNRRRGYLIATPKSIASAVLTEAWKQDVQRLERRASVPMEAFLSPQPPGEFEQTKRMGEARKDQVRWKDINRNARQDESLGSASVLTHGPHNDPTPSLPHAPKHSTAWLAAPTPRLDDNLNIYALREAKAGTDLMTKSRMVDSVQSVRFGQGSAIYGVSACLTSQMGPFLTNLARPLTGRECFALQGLPVDRLDLTGLSETRLIFMAGNAMSTTAVGTALVAALMAARPLFGRKGGPRPISRSSSFERDGSAKQEEQVSKLRDEFEPWPAGMPSGELVERARRSGRACECEGECAIATGPFFVNPATGTRICQGCKPQRGPTFEPDRSPRADPNEVSAELLELLPGELRLTGFDHASLKALAGRVANLDTDLMPAWAETVSAALEGAKLKSQKLVREVEWVATWSAAKARVELSFGRVGLEWRVFVGPPAEWATEDPLRLGLSLPAARMTIGQFEAFQSMLEGDWQVSVPLDVAELSAEFSFVGEEVPSWRATLRLPEFLDETRNSRIKVILDGNAVAALDEDVSGEYELQPDSGVACDSLYKRISVGGQPADPSARPLFFFLDSVAD